MDNCNISYWRVIVFLIFLNIVYNNSTPLGTNCVTSADFNVTQMAGTWHLIAGIYRLGGTITCGGLTLREGSKHRLMGHATMKFLEVISTAAIQAYVADEIFAMRYVWNDTISKEQLFAIKTCDSKNEFSLENEKDGWFLIFGRNNSVTSYMLDHYRQYAIKESLQLRFVHGTEC